jgi:hypothetical protein
VHAATLPDKCRPAPACHLQDKLVSTVGELYTFMDASDGTLVRKLLGENAEGEESTHETPRSEPSEDAATRAAAEQEAHRQSLYAILSCMRDIRKRTDRTDAMFEPLQRTVTLLQVCVGGGG